MTFEPLQPDWKGRDVYLIGGGSSLKEFNFNKIQGKGVIFGVNDCAFKTQADCLFSLDTTWAGQRKQQIIDFKGDKFLGLPNSFFFNEWEGSGVHFLLRERGVQFNDDASKINGVNSGFGALNVCYHKRPKRVFMLGFDMYKSEQGTHWHNGYDWNSPEGHRYYDRWCVIFDNTVEQLKAADIEVYNCNPESKITCYSKEITYNDL